MQYHYECVCNFDFVMTEMPSNGLGCSFHLWAWYAVVFTIMTMSLFPHRETKTSTELLKGNRCRWGALESMKWAFGLFDSVVILCQGWLYHFYVWQSLQWCLTSDHYSLTWASMLYLTYFSTCLLAMCSLDWSVKCQLPYWDDPMVTPEVLQKNSIHAISFDETVQCSNWFLLH